MKSPMVSNYPFSKSLTGGNVLEGFEPIANFQSREDRLLRMQAMQMKRELPIAKKPVEKKKKQLTYKEVMEAFDTKEALKMAYVPHFITQVVIYYLDQIFAYVRAEQISEVKKYTRQLREIKNEYLSSLKCEMRPQIFNAFLELKDKYLAKCGANLSLVFFSVGNLLLKRYKHIKYEPLYTYTTIILFFIDYVEEYDRKCNKRISEVTGAVCHNHGDARLTAIKKLCKFICKDYQLDKCEQVEMCISVMANKAIEMVNEMNF